MKFERKLNNTKKTTDLFEEVTGKIYEVNTDHKTFLMIQELSKNDGKTQEEQQDDENKCMELMVGKENWKEIIEALEKMPNYFENLTTAKIELYSIEFNLSFEEMVKRFQGANK